jgi:predicted dehydrogenase
MDPQEEILRSENCPDGMNWGEDWGVEAESQWGTLRRVGGEVSKIKTERGDYRGFYANVRDAMEKRAPLDVTPEQALRTMRALLLSHKSSREGRKVRWTEAVQ